MEKQRLTNFLDSIMDEHRNDSTVTVIPVRCGLGKSTYIINYIRKVIDSDITDGIIVITDSVSRLEEYANYKELCENYKKQIAILKADNISETIKTQSYCKVLLMTTQRYFRLARCEIMSLLRYSNGKRTTIIFDEKPYFNEIKHITIKQFNDVDSALLMGVDDTVNQTEKIWCINQWERLKEHIQSTMDRYEHMTDKSQFYLWHKDEWEHMTADDMRFIDFIERNKDKLKNQTYVDAYNLIKLIRRIFEEGAIFSCKKLQSGEYCNEFVFNINHRDKLINLGAKVFVLDGSADISPEYETDYIEIIDCGEFDIPLTNLTINCVNIKTSKQYLCSGNVDAKNTIEIIKEYIEKQKDLSHVFTYKKIEDEFNPLNTEHFGNIKGRNDFREATHIAQVGLNRYTNLDYFLMYNSADDLDMLFVKSLTIDRSIEAFDRILSSNTINGLTTEDTMFWSVLSDIEQNMFRSAIRNVDYTGNVVYTIFFNTNSYSYLIDLLKERYGKLGAIINVQSAPIEVSLDKIQRRQTEEPTHAQRILKWLDSKPNGTIFKLKEMLYDNNLSNKQFDKLKNNNSSIAELFKRMTTGKRGYYRVV